MKVNETIEIISQFETVSPTVFRAQRQAELQNMALYNAEKIQKYKDWAEKPEHREALKAKVEGEAQVERKVVSAEAEKFAKWFDEKDERQLGAIKEISRPIKLSWWQRLLAWFERF